MIFFELPFIRDVLPILFFTYLVIVSFTRILKIRERGYIYLLMFSLTLYLVFSSIFLTNVYNFNNGESLSYGSDSNLYEEMLHEVQTYSKFEHAEHYNRMKYDKKAFTVYLNSFFYRNITNNYINSIIILILNIFYHISSVIITILLIEKNSWYFKNNKLVISFFIFTNIAGLIIIPTFLREAFNLFIVLEIIYLYTKNKRQWLLIAIGLFILYNTRSYFTYIFVFVFLFNRLNADFFKSLNYFRIVLYFALFIAVLLLDFNIINYFLRKLLEIHPGDAHHFDKFRSLYLEHGSYAQTSSLELLFLLVQRIIFGVTKFILTPISLPYFNNIFIGGNFINAYYGVEARISSFLYAFVYNFLTFPLLTSFIFNLSNNLKRIKKYNTEFFNVLITLLSFIVFIYGVKFLGQRNQKIDYIYFFLLNLFLLKFPIRKNGFFFGIIIMILLNFVLIIL